MDVTDVRPTDRAGEINVIPSSSFLLLIRQFLQNDKDRGAVGSKIKCLFHIPCCKTKRKKLTTANAMPFSFLPVMAISFLPRFFLLT